MTLRPYWDPSIACASWRLVLPHSCGPTHTNRVVLSTSAWLSYWGVCTQRHRQEEPICWVPGLPHSLQTLASDHIVA